MRESNKRKILRKKDRIEKEGVADEIVGWKIYGKRG